MVTTVLSIQTEADYDRALSEVESLWEAKPDTKEGGRLDALLLLIEEYEQKNHPVGDLGSRASSLAQSEVK